MARVLLDGFKATLRRSARSGLIISRTNAEPAALCSDAVNLDIRAVDIAPKRPISLDTLAAVKFLQNHDFTDKQAEGIVSLIVHVIEANNDRHRVKFVTKEAEEIMVQQIIAQIASVKKDMVILEKSEFSALRNETDKLLIEMARVRDHMSDALIKMKSGLTLDMNLERSRSVEVQSEQKNELSRIDNRIGTEVANLKTTFETYRNDLFKYGAGTIVSCLTITLGFYRLWS